ncbi:MAG: hypothetical protein HY753_02680 [Nitrospirae bacterium]|nr:hypothetical protein [Nitrospirota bacterium]
MLSERGLKSSEKEAIPYTLKNYRHIKIDNAVALRYPELRELYPRLDKEDILIAATEVLKHLPLVT